LISASSSSVSPLSLAGMFKPVDFSTNIIFEFIAVFSICFEALSSAIEVAFAEIKIIINVNTRYFLMFLFEINNTSRPLKIKFAKYINII
jgi:hypothetical protein